MFTEIIGDIFDSVSYIFQGSSLIVIVLMVALSIFAGLRMNSASGIFGWVFESTILLGFFTYLYNWLTADGRFSFAVWEQETLRAWDAMMAFSVQELTGYFALFFLLIFAVHIVKRFARG